MPLLNKETVKNEFRANTEELVKKQVKKSKIPRAKFKRFLRLAQELGLHNDQPGNDRYEYQNRTEQEISADLVNKLDRYRPLPDDSERKVALLYHNPIFHKNPIKFRFIAGNVKIVTSQSDASVAKILKMCKEQVQNNLLCGYSGWWKETLKM